MKCARCNGRAIFDSPNLCRKHFILYYEKKVKDTIKDYSLIDKDDKVCVATSGGKDSLTVLFLMKRFGFDPTALFIDEGISCYREHTIKDLKRFCEEHSIRLKVISFKEEFGKTLDQILKLHKSWKPCTVCGTLRRYLLNKYSRGFDKLVTGHNLDDEAQAIMMNFLRANLELSARLGPKTGTSSHKGFVQRVKPLYFCSERATAAYSFLHGFTSFFTECPYVVDAYRASVRDLLNGHEAVVSGSKHNIIKSFLLILPKLKSQASKAAPSICGSCGEPSADKTCATCNLVKML